MALLVLAAALGLSLVLTPIARRVALRTGFVAVPVARSIHAEPKPYLGGVAIYLAFAAATLIGRLVTGVGIGDRGFLGILVCGALVVLLGTADDRWDLRPSYKLLGTIAIAALLVWGFDVYIPWVHSPFSDKYISLDWLGIGRILTVFWIISFMHGLNLIDGLDGLCAGIAAIASLTLLIISLQLQQSPVVVLTAALAGAAVGFLRYNFNPARIFMGDAGALFLGFALGAVSVHGVMKSTVAVGVLVPVLAVGLPILDTVVSIIRRVSSGRSLGEADKDHLHHRLLRMGLSHRNAVLVMWAISAWLGIGAVAVSELGARQALLIVALLASALIALAVSLGALRVRGQREDVKH